MDRILFTLFGLLIFAVLFRIFSPLLVVFFFGIAIYSLFKLLFAPKQQQEDYYEQTVHNPHQNTQSDIIDVEAVIIEEE